jgi:hypothetical protein
MYYYWKKINDILVILKEYVWRNVRGGKSPDSLIPIIPPTIDNNKTNVNTITNKYSNSHINKQNSCYRCGRIGHYANNCYAKTTISGHIINDYSDSDSDNSYNDNDYSDYTDNDSYDSY